MEAVLGFAIALLVGMTGMGGGPLAAPLLMLALGVPAPIAVGTSLLFVTITKLTAGLVYWRRGLIHWPSWRLLMYGGGPGALAGSFLLQRMTHSSRLQPLILTLIGFVILALAIVSFVKAFRRTHPQIEQRERPQALPWLALPIGLEVGFSSAGAGALTSLSLMQCTRLDARQIVGTDLAFGLGIAALGGSVHLAAGSVNLPLLFALSAGGVFGAFTGAWLANRIPVRLLRATLSVVMLFLGQQLLAKGIDALAR